MANPSRIVEPSDWPDWVLAYRGGYFHDPVRAEQALQRFHQWQRDRDAWVAEHVEPTPGGFLQAAARERQRRRQA